MKRRGAALGAAIITSLSILFVVSLAISVGSTRAAAPAGERSPALPQAALVSAPERDTPKPGAPQVSTWTDVAPFPTVTIDFTPSPQSAKIKRAGAAAYPPNGKLYVLGGRHGTDGEDINLRSIFEYTPGTPGTWAQKTALLDSSQPGSRWTANMAVAVLTDSNGVRIYAVGGNNINSEITSTVRVYNPVADTLSTLTTDPWPASPARVPGGYAVYNNKLYIFGGFSALGSGAVFADTWVFDPQALAGARWTQLNSAPLPLARGYIAGAVLDGKIYAIGGDTWDPATRALVGVTNVDVLDPNNVAGGWSPRAALPTARGDLGAWAYNTGTGYEISGSIVVAGGVYPVPDGTAYQYAPLSNSWNPFPGFVHATRNYGTAQLNGLLYAFGGYDYSNGIPAGANFNQRYDATGAPATPTNTPIFSPTPTPTPDTSNYGICQSSGASIVPGTTLVPGSSCGDCIVSLVLPFPYRFYDQTFNAAKLTADGNLGFVSADGNLVNHCLPDLGGIYTIYGYWDDLDTTGTGNGIYTSISGSAPNRVLNIEWRAVRAGGSAVNFEIRLYEGQTVLDIIYGAVSTGGNSATVGVQKDTGSIFSQFSCNTSSLSAGLQLTFGLNSAACASPTPTYSPSVTSTPTNSPTLTPTPTGTLPTSTPTGTATATPCGTATNYIVSQSTGATIEPGTTDTGNHGDDTTTAISLPFGVRFYGQTYTGATLSSNGNLQFTGASTAYSNVCLPTAALTDAVLGQWDDLRTDQTGTGCPGYGGVGCGIFTSVSGAAPDRILNVEWRAVYFSSTSTQANFEIRLYESQDRIDMVYGTTGTGSSATVGVQAGTGTSLFTEFECNTGGLSSGLLLVFTQPPCSPVTNTPTPVLTSTSTASATFTATSIPTSTSTATSTNTPQSLLAGHVTWQSRPAQPNALNTLPISLTLRLASGGADTNFTGLTTDASGWFTVSLGSLPAGQYNWRAKGPLFLATGGPVSLSGAALTNVEMGLQKAGDCNNDNIVNATDFGVLRATFGKSVGQPGYDARADFDGNNTVNALDFNVQRNNFGIGGAPPISPAGRSAGD